jgi:hypothetical protein
MHAMLGKDDANTYRWTIQELGNLEENIYIKKKNKEEAVVHKKTSSCRNNGTQPKLELRLRMGTAIYLLPCPLRAFMAWYSAKFNFLIICFRYRKMLGEVKYK